MRMRLMVAVGFIFCILVGCRSGASPTPKASFVARPDIHATKPAAVHLAADNHLPDADAVLREGVVTASDVGTADVTSTADANTQVTNDPSTAVGSASVEQVVLDHQPIDLTTALLMTSGENPQVTYARARIEEALAQVDKAEALKLPSLRAGLNYNKHEGRIQDVAGTIIDTSRGSYYTGLGANAVGAGSPAIPGIVSQFHFADAIFQPRIAQRTACARQAGARATINEQLLNTALAYNELLRAEQEVALLNDVVAKAESLTKATAEFEKAGAGLAADHDRARTELALRKNEQLRAEEAAAVASSRLAELIRWDSHLKLVPSEVQVVPIELVSPQYAQSELVAISLSTRPELTESRHLVGEAVERLRREQHAPLIPSVLLAASYGGLGGGLGSDLTNFGDRLDADAVAYWEVRQLGLGEQAAKREARSRIMQARAKELATMDRVARETNEAYAQVVARKKQIAVTQEAVAAAQSSFERNWDRIRNAQGLPLEVLQSMQALATAQREYVRVVCDYNAAQFNLQKALGWPVSAQ